MKDIVTLTEGGPAVRWPGGGLERLRRLGTRWRAALRLGEDPFLIRGSTVASRAVTGFVQVGGTQLQVRPKFLDASDDADDRWVRALWATLAAIDPRARSLGLVGSTTARDGQADLLARSFLHHLVTLPVTGLPRGYVEQRLSLPVLRGSLDSSRLDELIVHPFQLPCVVDSYEEDIAINRLLRWAAEQLVRLTRSANLSAEIGELASLFQGVSPVPPTVDEAARVTIPAAYRQLAPAVDLARLLLEQSALVHGAEAQLATGFLWRSHVVFERMIQHLSRLASPDLNVEFDNSTQLLARRLPSGRKIRTRPDVRLVREGRTLAVLDAKYKLLSTGGSPAPEDVYQVLTGAALANTPDAALVYPATVPNQPPVLFEIETLSRPDRLTLLFVDLLRMAEPDGQRVLVASLRTELAPMIGAATVHDEQLVASEGQPFCAVGSEPAS